MYAALPESESGAEAMGRMEMWFVYQSSLGGEQILKSG